MTEAEWLAATDFEAALDFLRDEAAARGAVSCGCCRTACVGTGVACPAYRKLRLFAAACCRRVLPALTDPVCGAALVALERAVEGDDSPGEYAAAVVRFDATRRARFPKHATPDDGAWNALYCAVHRRWEGRYDEEYAAYRWHAARVVADDAATAWPGGHVDLLREVFGNPFRPAAIGPGWRTATVLALARQMYESRDFSAMPILADALQDAGCEHADILGHCRRPEPHVRGCWVVDLLLGKE